VKTKSWKKLNKKCRRDKIAEGALVFGAVPLLNWLGQHLRGDENSEDPLIQLLLCLIQGGHDLTEIPEVEGDIPADIKAYRERPLLFHATEAMRYDIIGSLAGGGEWGATDLSQSYVLPNGSPSGITSLHAAMILSGE
jgi:hypothetical protein